MWFNFFRDKEKERERSKTEMELALASIPDKERYEFEIKLIEQKEKERILEMLNVEKEIHKRTISILVPVLFKTGRISDEEYNKYLLDETGNYLPKLKSEL